MKWTIFLLTSVLITGASAKKLTPDEERLLKMMREQNGKVNVVNESKKQRFNSKLRVVRDDNRIMKVPMSIKDRVDLMTCYNSPTIIKFGESVDHKVNAVYLGNHKFFAAKKLEQNEKAVLISMTKPLDKGNFQTTLWLERTGDKRSYVFNLIAEPCPSKGILPYPAEVVIEDKLGVVSKNQRLMIPSDLIMELSKGMPMKNDANFIRVNGLMATANSSFVGLSISIILKNTPGAKDSKGNPIIKKPKFVFLDSLKVRTIDNDSKYLEHSSKGESKINQLSTLRFDTLLNVDKKYIFERRFVYLMVLFEDLGYYQLVKIPLKDLHDDLRKKGFEV